MIVVLWGVSGCGKTTVGRLLARALDCDFHDADDFHPQANVDKMRAGTPLTDDDRWPWLEELAETLRHTLGQGGRAVLACSALKQAYRDRLQVDPARVRFVHLAGSFATIAARLGSRQHEFMNDSLLQSQFDALEPCAVSWTLDIAASPTELCRQVLTLLEQDAAGNAQQQAGRQEST